MNKSFKHYIFTNFGIGIKDELWLMYRMEILLNTVFPSLANQSTTDFEWIIFADTQLPAVHLHRLQQAIAQTALNAKIIQVDDYSLVSNEVSRLLKNEQAPTVITSRIDDDDCIHANVMALIQEAALNTAVSEQVLVISLNNGIEFLPSDNCYREVTYDTLALALTLVDRSPGIKEKSITQYAHHLVIKTLEKHNIPSAHISLKKPYPLFLYTKHPLSDSYFFGARARILGDTQKITGFDPKFFSDYGLTQESLNYLCTMLRQSPIGMPHKYLEKLGNLRNEIKKTLREPTENSASELEVLTAKKERFERRAVRPNPVNGASEKIRVAILGSCVTRDLFEFQTSALGDFEVCFYMARSSVISYMGMPCTDTRVRISGEGFEDKRAAYDLAKNHWADLEKARPDIILIDFIDERIGLIQHHGSIFSASGPMIKAFERAGIEFEIKRPWSAEAKALRAWALPAFLEKASSICPNIFVHKAVWANTYRNATNQVESFDTSEFAKLIELNNEIINNMLAPLEDSSTAVEQIGGMESGLMAGGDHKWAFCPYHYTSTYYKTVAKQLLARIMN
ncbi:putative rhamnosyl transferase [Pseudomonas sivasensis]|uniref:putative rhamnosyl transferase n=1 Tax=Pseudomonas sivasensis TaxID=1880678 RepID=UPI0021A9CFC3|nr:putative rhamnosyl transferase [Pseudomonas sivasensis]MCT4496273.1 putative rhamnosyl transferase [Pseudomonas sivasensis]